MPQITQHAPGMFSWADLSTPDPSAAKAFYGALFGWSYDDTPAGPDAEYSVARLGEGRAAALYRQGKEETKSRMPARWNCYFTVKDVDATSKKVKRLEGQLLCPPFDVFDSGRMCIFAEPAEGVAALWQPKTHIGATLMGEHGTLGWAELLSREPDASMGFLIKLFGFDVESMDLPTGSYNVFRVDGRPSCGMLEMPDELPEDLPSFWVPYFNVADCDQSVKSALAAGGKEMVPAMEVPGVGRFAMLADPHGAVFSVITSASP